MFFLSPHCDGVLPCVRLCAWVRAALAMKCASATRLRSIWLFLLHLKRWQALLRRGTQGAGKAGLAACKALAITRNAHAGV